MSMRNILLLILATQFTLLNAEPAPSIGNDDIRSTDKEIREVLSLPVPSYPTVAGTYVHSAELDSLIALVIEDSVRSDVISLESLERLVGTPGNRAARDFIYDKFDDAGYDSLYLGTLWGQQLPDRTWATCYNVVATKLGTVHPEKHIVIGGHFDAVPDVPGADDNASGTVGVMHIAKALAQFDTECTIRLVAFDSEESGVWGSRDYAYGAAENGDEIIFMINLDMIGNEGNDTDANLWTGPETGYAQLWADIAGDLVGITGHLAGSVGSDNWPFMWNGYPVMFLEEYVWSSNYHRATDHSGHINFDYLTRMIQGTLATAYVAANSPAPVVVLSADDMGDGNSVRVTWRASDAHDLAGYTVYARDAGGALDSIEVGPGLTETVIAGLVTGQEYAFAVRAVDDVGNTSHELDWESMVPTTAPITPVFKLTGQGWPVEDGAESAGACVVDVDNDGYQDIFVTNYGYYFTRGNRLYRNTGDGTFTRIFDDTIVRSETWSYAASFTDYDNDGDLDAALPAYGGHGLNLYANRGDGHFDLIENFPEAGDAVGASWADVNNDGYCDLLVANFGNGMGAGAGANMLYINNHGILSHTVPDGIGTDTNYTRSATWCDYDNDGDMDLFAANAAGGANRLYRNDGDLSFTSVDAGSLTFEIGSWRGGSWGDYDNDGDFDLFVTGYEGNVMGLYRNDLNDVFVERPGFNDLPIPESGGSFGAAWGDYDNDGDLDIFIAIGNLDDPFGTVNRLYENEGGAFTRVTTGPLTWDRGFSIGAACGDFDSDGDLDVYVTKDFNLHNSLLENTGNDNHWLNVRCVGTISNTSAIGTKVRVLATIDGQPVWQHREISSQTGFCCQSSLNAHFGLADATVIDSLVLEWPSGLLEVYTNVQPDHHVTLVEGVTDADFDGVADSEDNCPDTYNPDQADTNDDNLGDACCCSNTADNRTGNVNCDPEGKRNLADISAIIDHVYLSKKPLCCPSTGNVNGSIDGNVNLADISKLIDHVYLTKAETAPCQYVP